MFYLLDAQITWEEADKVSSQFPLQLEDLPMPDPVLIKIETPGDDNNIFISAENASRYFSPDVIVKEEETGTDTLVVLGNPHKEDYHCCRCSKTFKTATNIRDHMTIHCGVKTFQCEDCGKTFKQRSHMTLHWKTHIGKNNFECSVCGKTFTRIYTLNQHLRIHQQCRKYVDSTDNMTADSTDNMNNGILVKQKANMLNSTVSEISNGGTELNMHGQNYINCSTETLVVFGNPHKEEYHCCMCSKAFKTEAHIRDHMAMHRCAKIFQCQDCGKTFKQPSEMTLHWKTHIGRKDSKCSESDNSTDNMNDEILFDILLKQKK